MEKDIKDSFIFVQGYDQMQYDMMQFNTSLTQQLARALADKRCMAINSSGYMKHTVDCLVKSPFVNDDQGIYIKKSCAKAILEGSVLLKPESLISREALATMI